MTDSPVHRRVPIRVREVHVAGVAMVAGVIASLADAHPTGRAVIDPLLTGLAVGVTTWAAASANWWALAMAAGVVAGTVSNLSLAAIGAVAAAAALVIGARRHSQAVPRAVVAGTVMNLAVRSELDITFAASAAIGFVVAIGLIADGLTRRRRRPRLVASLAIALSVGLAVVASVVLALVAWRTYDDVRSGEQLVQTGLDALLDGDDDAAREAFSAAADSFDSVERAMNSPLAAPAALVPVVSQHRTALADMAMSASATSDEIVQQLDALDIDSLRIVDGVVDLQQLRSLDEQVVDIRDSLEQLRSTTTEVDSVWLLDAVSRRLDDVRSDVTAQIDRGDEVAEALRVAPALLGADGPRTYLVGFLTPAEARGGVGFLGAMAEISADNGRIEMTKYWESISELNGFTDGVRLEDAPPDWIDRYGVYGFTSGSEGRVSGDAWSNVTLSPHFPSTARVIQEMYADGVGRQVDGVFALDVRALAAIVVLTGPIEVDGPQGPLTLTSDTLEQFLLIEQYRLDSPESQDILEDVARTTVDKLLRSTLPSPATIVDVLSPIAREGRITAWSNDESEQRFFASRDLAGALPNDAGDRSGFAITFNNGNPSKIDSFLDVDIDHAVTLSDDLSSDTDSGTASSITTVTITNAVSERDIEELPEVVTGNAFNLPPGTNRSLIDVFTLAPIEQITRDGQSIKLTRGEEAGWSTASFFIDLAPGSTTTLVVTTAPTSVGSLGDAAAVAPTDRSSGHSVVVRVPPLARPVTGQVRVIHPGGTAQTELPTAGLRRVAL